MKKAKDLTASEIYSKLYVMTKNGNVRYRRETFNKDDRKHEKQCWLRLVSWYEFNHQPPKCIKQAGNYYLLYTRWADKLVGFKANTIKNTRIIPRGAVPKTDKHSISKLVRQLLFGRTHKEKSEYFLCIESGAIKGWSIPGPNLPSELQKCIGSQKIASSL